MNPVLIGESYLHAATGEEVIVADFVFRVRAKGRSRQLTAKVIVRPANMRTWECFVVRRDELMPVRRAAKPSAGGGLPLVAFPQSEVRGVARTMDRHPPLDLLGRAARRSWAGPRRRPCGACSAPSRPVGASAGAARRGRPAPPRRYQAPRPRRSTWMSRPKISAVSRIRSTVRRLQPKWTAISAGWRGLAWMNRRIARPWSRTRTSPFPPVFCLRAGRRGTRSPAGGGSLRHVSSPCEPEMRHGLTYNIS
jgi:hypothetical protein